MGIQKGYTSGNMWNLGFSGFSDWQLADLDVTTYNRTYGPTDNLCQAK